MKTALQKSPRLGVGLAPIGQQSKRGKFANWIEFQACRLGDVLFPQYERVRYIAGLTLW